MQRDWSIRDFIYLDAKGIESLYSQTVERVETETSKRHKRATAGRATGRLAFGKLLAYLSLGDAEANAALETSREHDDQTTFKFSIEQKLQLLLDSLLELGEPALFQDLDRAASHCIASEDAAFIWTTDKFDLPFFAPGCDGVAASNAAGCILFERDSRKSYDYTDSYYKKAQRIEMLAGLGNLTRTRDGKMAGIGHEAMYFRAHAGKGVRLRVFGRLRGSSQYLQIKPYTIAI